MLTHGKLKKFITLIILDGWGIAEEGEDNLIRLTPTANFDKLVETYPAAVLTNPLDKAVLQAENEDVCRLSHYLLGTSTIENHILTLEKIDPLAVKSLSRVLSKHNLKQLYLAEPEKFPQLAYFFRGCYSKILKGEEEFLAQNGPANGADGASETSLKNIIKELKKQLETKKFNFIAINLANIDIAAHSGNREETIAAIKLVDQYLGEIVEKILDWGGDVIITGDHGKAENFCRDEAMPHLCKAHTASKLPFIFASNNWEGQSLSGVKLIGNDLNALEPSGYLVDIAPTILRLLNIKKPDEMVGKSLL